MARYALAAIIACLYVAASVWIVQGEGARYRARQRAGARAPIARAGPVSSPRVAIAPRPGPTAPRTPEVTPERRVETAPEERGDPAPAVAIAPTPAPAVELAPGSILRTAGDLPPPPADAAWADSLDLSRLKPEDEQRLGSDLHQLVLTHAQPAPGGPWLKRTQMAARRVSDTPYSITILESDAVNAFSHPGGYIYLCRGLFDLIGSDEDYALEFVIGHEMAHVELKHALRCVQVGNAAAKSRGVDTLNQFLVPIAMGYPDAQEFEADGRAFRQMVSRLGHTRRESLAFLRKFQGYAEEQGFENGRKVPDPDSGLVENHFLRHPATWDRLERLKSLYKVPTPGTPK